ncbi:hypothetical protein [Neobacillus sp. YIM B06451]|uniref:hypothetical protein n=1 Tax=Neobacillus sp. YIM B06451 TaxID=3070994 RepID=UPI00292EC95C|nr:hypothetical protein [Neobacillus sp. YIM B06451]
MKKLVLCLVSVFLLVVASACSGDANTSSAKSGDDKKSEETAEQNNETKSDDSTSEETESEESTSQETKATISAEEAYAYGLAHDLPIITEDALELGQVSYDFIANNHTLFPAKTDADIQKVKSMVDSSVNYKLLNKNPSPYFEKIVSFEGDVITVEEQNLENGDVVSVTHIMDDEGNSYEVIMYKSTGDLLEEDRARFWGLPLGAYSFENVSGGSTNVQEFFGATIEKIQ